MPNYLECSCGNEIFKIVSNEECICTNCHKNNSISDMKLRQEIEQIAIAEIEKQALEIGDKYER